MSKESHEPLNDVEIVLEANLAEVAEQHRLVESQQPRCEQRRISKVEVLCQFFKERSNVDAVDLPNKWKDQTFSACPVHLNVKHHHD